MKLNMIVFKDNSEHFSIGDCIEIYRDDIKEILSRELDDKKVKEYINKTSEEIRKAVNRGIL